MLIANQEHKSITGKIALEYYQTQEKIDVTCLHIAYYFILLIVQAKNKIAIAPDIDLIPTIQERAYSGHSLTIKIIKSRNNKWTESTYNQRCLTTVFSNAPKH